MSWTTRHALGALVFGTSALAVPACGDDITAACEVYCKCASCDADACKTQLTSARSSAATLGCAAELDAYLLCTRASLDCTKPFANAGACKAEVEAALACGVDHGLGTQDCEGKGRFVDALVAGCDTLSQSGTYAPSNCEPVTQVVIDCRLGCAEDYECSNSLDSCLEGCASQI